MDRRKLVDKRSGFYSTKRTSALDGLLGKLDQQMAQEPPSVKFQSPQIKSPTVSIAKENLFKIGANPFNPPMARGRRKSRASTHSDPLNMKTKMQKAREARRNAILARHKGGTYSTTDRKPDDVLDEVEGDLKDDLETAEKFVNENKDKTMDWTEPDGSKTTLKFDENGTLIGKETTKSRPEKFSRDLKKAVDKNAVALKDYEQAMEANPQLDRT